MSESSDDLIAFTESDHTNTARFSVLQEFDPLFEEKLNAGDLSPVLPPTIRRTEQNNHSFRANHVFDQSSSKYSNRAGGVFDKDKIWGEIIEFAPDENISSDREIVKQDIPPSAPSTTSPQNLQASQQTSAGTFLLRRSITIDSSLLNFVKSVEICTHWFTPTKDTFPLVSDISLHDLPRPNSPVSLNAYLFDAILGSATSYRLHCEAKDEEENLVEDWRVNPGLMWMTNLCPLPNFLAVPGPSEMEKITLKIYVPLPVYFCKRYDDTVRNWLKQRLQTTCLPTKIVSSLVEECLREVFADAEKPPKPSDYCLRICGRTDLLHPNARLCDHEYIQDCCRTSTTVRLVLEYFSAQEFFFPTAEDKALHLNVHNAYYTETRIPARVAIENSLEKISNYIEILGKQISNFSFEGVHATGNTCELLRQAVGAHISEICQGAAINTLSEAMAAVQNSLYNLILSRKPRKHSPFLRSLTSPRLMDREDEEQVVLEKLAVLEMQVIRQTIAFLKWKQAWYPDIKLSPERPSPFVGCRMECERLLGCHIAADYESHRMSKCDMPLVLRIGSVIDPCDLSGISELTSSGGCVRVHVVLTYGGRPLSIICSQTICPTYPRNIPECAEYACTTPVLRDFHFSRKADFNAGGKINEWIRFLDFPFRRLPRETLLNVSLIALKKQTEDPVILNNGTLLGWVNIPLFDANGRLRQEVVLAGLWPATIEGLSPESRSTFTEPNRSSDAIVVEIEFPVYEHEFYFSTPLVAGECNPHLARLSQEERNYFIEAATQILYTPTSQNSPSGRRPVESTLEPKFTTFLTDLRVHQSLIDQLWQFRDRLVGSPELLATLLVAAPVCWPESCRRANRVLEKVSHEKILWMLLLSQLYNLIKYSAPLPPGGALRLLLPDVPDQLTRHWAVSCISQFPPDGLICYLPSLLEAVNYDLYLDWSGLVSLLLHRASVSLRFCNALYWHIKSILMTPKWHKQRRLVLLKTAIEWLRGSRLKAVWSLQADVLTRICHTAESVKAAKDKTKLRTLQEGLDSIQGFLDCRFKSESSTNCSLPISPVSYRSQNSCSDLPTPDAFRLPYDFGFVSRGFKMDGCTYITSFTCPIKLTFSGIDGETRQSIFKAGDDLQMDLLICQLVHVADRIWLSGGLDLCIPHFTVMPTEPKRGLIEPVPDSETLRLANQASTSNPQYKRDQGLLLWLRNNQPNMRALGKAVHNFVHSTVAGSVLTFVLGLGDRHNDNIMMRTNGQSFHIDFSKVFGNFQKILSFNRDRSPFILTPDMLEIVKSAEPTSSKLRPREDMAKELVEIPSFVQHCCQAYKSLRKNAFSIMGVMEMAWQMQLPGLERGQIGHVYGNLRRSISDAEADAFFKELIQRSIQSYSAQFNNMIHDKVQRSKKQPTTVDNVEDCYTPYVAQGVYLYLHSAAPALADNAPSNFGLARISVTESSISRNGRYLKPVFKFEILPDAGDSTDSSGGCPPRGFHIYRDTHELKRLAWRLLDSHPNNRLALNLLNKLNEMDDQVLNCAQPSPPSGQLVNALKMALVDLIQFYSRDPSMISFWKPTESDVSTDVPQGTNPDTTEPYAKSGEIFTPLSDEQANSHSEDSTPPDGPAVRLTLELSESCDRLEICVEEGNDWWLGGENLTVKAVINARITQNLLRSLIPQRSCTLLSNNPKLNERFSFELTPQAHKEAALIFTARQLDTQGMKHLIGEATIPLNSLPHHSKSNKITRWYELSRRTFEHV